MRKFSFVCFTLAVALTACGGGAGGALPTSSTSITSPSSNGTNVPPSPAPLDVCGAIELPVATGNASSPFSSTTTCAISEANYTGAFGVTDDGTCANIVTFTPASPFTGPSSSISITQVGGGVCTLTISDVSGQKQTVSVGSTWVTGVAQ